MLVLIKGNQMYARPISGTYQEGGLKKMKVILEREENGFVKEEHVAVWMEKNWEIRIPKKASKVKTKKTK